MVVFVVGLFTLRAASLAWTAAENRDWNTTATNWGVVRSNYVDGDSVIFRDAGAGDVFIGSNGIPMDVAPTLVSFSVTNSFQNGYTVRGGNIVSGAIAVYGTTVSFRGYSNSLSFPGGLDIGDSYGVFSFDLSRFADGSSVHLGTGPITLRYGGWLNCSTTNAGIFTIENDIGGLGVVTLPSATNRALRFTGAMTLNPRLDFIAGISSGPETATNEIAGPLVVDQESTGERTLNLSSWTTALRISGVISDGPGEKTNALRFYTYYGGIVLAASNTYAHGTRVQSSGAPAGPVTVLPGATLGTGDVDASLGMLVLTDAGNISRSASLKWGYQIMVTNRAKIRVASVDRSGSLLPDGIYTANSGMGILGDGSIRIPGTNLPPTVVVTAPTNGVAFRDDEIVRFRVQPADVDGFIERVDFYLDGMNVRVRTNAPFSASFTNVGVGTHLLEAVAFDDDGGSVVSSPVIFHVRTRLTMSPNGAVLEFPAAAQTPYTLQVTRGFSPPAWSNVMSFGPGSERVIRYTNHIVPPPPASFYRVISP
jgi:hypothetical protein